MRAPLRRQAPTRTRLRPITWPRTNRRENSASEKRQENIMRIGNINSLPWYLRLGLFAVLALSLYGGFWYLVNKGTRNESRGVEDQISVLQKANAEAQICLQRLKEFPSA